MAKKFDRRDFIKKSVAASAAAGMAFGFEEKCLLAKEDQPSPAASGNPVAMPTGKIGDVTVSRLICGGNLISGFAHSRDLIYISSVLKHYFTDEKVFETFRLCEANGINMAILRLDDNTLRIVKKYGHEMGGNLQWIAQIKPTEHTLVTDAKRAVDEGAIGVYLQGEAGDAFTKAGRIDILAKAIECIKNNGVIAGMGAHSLDVVKACEKEGIPSDFYMKTINSKRYWSAGPTERHDSVWEETPEETIEFMKGVAKPWIGFKVLGAGAIPPKEGFQYALENGADFICVGMFDFQVHQDASIAVDVLALPEVKNRTRAWRA